MIWNMFIGLSLLIGLVANTLGIVGVLRFPDVYTQLHAETKATTYGSIFTSLAVILYGISKFCQTSDGQYVTLILHALIAVVVLAITNATGAHAIARATYRRGHRPVKAVVDHLEGFSK